jgi:hypothetical protein
MYRGLFGLYLFKCTDMSGEEEIERLWPMTGEQEILALRSELQKQKELNAELVEVFKGLVSQGSFRGGFPHTTFIMESLIKKYKES